MRLTVRKGTLSLPCCVAAWLFLLCMSSSSGDPPTDTTTPSSTTTGDFDNRNNTDSQHHSHEHPDSFATLNNSTQLTPSNPPHTTPQPNNNKHKPDSDEGRNLILALRKDLQKPKQKPTQTAAPEQPTQAPQQAIKEEVIENPKEDFSAILSLTIQNFESLVKATKTILVSFDGPGECSPSPSPHHSPCTIVLRCRVYSFPTSASRSCNDTRSGRETIR